MTMTTTIPTPAAITVAARPTTATRQEGFRPCQSCYRRLPVTAFPEGKHVCTRCKTRRDRMCRNKEKYRDAGHAAVVALACVRKRGGMLHPYECDYCGKWHLTSKIHMCKVCNIAHLYDRDDPCDRVEAVTAP